MEAVTKPKKKGTKKYWIILGIVLIVFGIFNARKKIADAVPASTNTASDGAAVPEIKQAWQYSQEVDKMDNGKSFFAQTVSTNEVEFQPPYNGGSSFTLTVQKQKNKPSDITIRVSQGQFLTELYNEKIARIKFDDEPPFNINIGGTSDYQSNVIFLYPPKKILQKLLKAKKMMVETEFFQDGKKQAEFDVQDLKWEYK